MNKRRRKQMEARTTKLIELRFAGAYPFEGQQRLARLKNPHAS